ncbi:MAG: DUF5716 family protein [Eubacteriales bacterium]|nr:DUF5716 family protein [Eubacteriales bacterium]
MKLFEVLPAEFFRLLTGSNREVYVESLLILHDVFKQSMHIQREEYLTRLTEKLVELEVFLEEEVEDGNDIASDQPSNSEKTSEKTSDKNSNKDSDKTSDEASEKEKSWSSMAHFILRRLIQTGWVEQETRPNSFEMLLTLPQYTIDMLELIRSITSQDTQVYKNYAFATYSALKTLIDEDEAEYRLAAFSSARENSNNLMTALKALLNNIRRYHRLLGELISANDILQGHFEGYQVLVNERIFHPMVTRDSVLRFKQPVLAIINSVMDSDEILEQIAAQAVAEKRYSDVDTAIVAILPELQEMADIFDSIDEVMTEIQLKNHSYTKASTDKLIYLLNQDRSVKEQLAKIIMNFGSLSNDTRRYLADNIAIFKQATVDDKSIYARSSRKIRSQEEPVKTKPVKMKEDDLTDFINSTSNRFSHAHVMKFVHDCFGAADVFDSRDLNLQGDDQFVMLLLAALKDGDKGLFYQVEYLRDSISYGRYTYPHMRFIKKEVLEAGVKKRDK